MFARVSELIELGVSAETIEAMVSTGEWKTQNVITEEGGVRPDIIISTLPPDIQTQLEKYTAATADSTYPEQLSVLLAETANHGAADDPDEIIKRLAPLPINERIAWLEESLRMARLIERYIQIRPKRQRHPVTGAWEFVLEVKDICKEAVCRDAVIVTKYKHLSKPPSAYKLDRAARNYRKKGLIIFILKAAKKPARGGDKRRSIISKLAVKWLNDHWRRFSGPRPLYKALEKEAKKKRWRIPSESWLYRIYRDAPAIITTYYQEGRDAYESKYAPYVPRDYSDLQALQVLCGDHSERDVTIALPDGTLKRPWVSLWVDLRCYLIWGWYISLIPSSNTAGLAYADGVQNFGAQPLSRPDDDFFSFAYTDRGRDYKSHNWDGKTISVHKQAISLEGGIEWLLVQRRVGIIDELELKHLLSRRRNAKERPVERVHRDFSDWEQNTFEEYCGRDAKSRPDRWKELYFRHQQFVQGKLSSSPFMSLDEYREHFAGFVTQFNNSPHERLTLGSKKIGDYPLDKTIESR